MLDAPLLKSLLLGGNFGRWLSVILDGYKEDGLGIAGLNFPHFAKFSDGPIGGKIDLASYEIMLWVAGVLAHLGSKRSFKEC